MEEDQEHTYRVVRFEVIPQSIRLEGEWGGISRGSGLGGLGFHTQDLLPSMAHRFIPRRPLTVP